MIIFGMTLVTYIPRMLPLVGLATVELPPWLLRWLSYVPAAVLAALLAPSVFMPEGYLQPNWHNLYLLAALPTMVVAVRTRSLVGTVVVGMVSMIVLQYLPV